MSLKAYVAVLALGVAAFTGQVEAKTIKVGVSPGPHAEVLEKVKPAAKEKGLDIEIIEFSDYVIPNAALDAGELDANSFQHQPYLDNQVEDRKFDIVSVATTINFPMGFYSSKHKSWDDVPDGATIAIQNDPTNGGRALLLLRDKGIINLRDGIGFKPAPSDVTDNPKNLKIIELEAAQTPRALADVDVAAINTNYAVDAGIAPSSAILREDPKGPYVNVIAVKTKDKDAQWVNDLIAAYRTPEIKAFVNERFDGAVLPSW